MTYEFSLPFRSAINFGRLARLVDSAEGDVSVYPSYNIERTGDDAYRLIMAVAGFGEDDLDLTIQDNTLVIVGRVSAEQSGAELLHRGIAGRSFERRFVLADHIVVEGANLRNGLLHVQLRRVLPDALKPRKITVSSARRVVANDQKAA